MLNTADVGAVVQAVNIGGGVPCGSRCQFITLQEDNIGPSEFSKMIENGASNDTSTNNDSLRMGFHGLVLCFVVPIRA